MNDSEECVEDVNAQLDKLCASLCCACFLHGWLLTRTRFLCSGYNIGMRLVDEYFAKTGSVRAVLRRCAPVAAHARGSCRGAAPTSATQQRRWRRRASPAARVAQGCKLMPTSHTQVALKMFLGVTANVSGWNAEGTSCSLVRLYRCPAPTRLCV